MKKIVIYTLIPILLIFLIYYLAPEKQLTSGQKADKIIILKSEHVLQLYNKNILIATYPVSLSKNGLAPKTKCGDGLTPEGTFKIRKRPSSVFHKGIDVGYGCDVLIHGQKYGWVGKFHRWKDWTKGCIALTNDEIDELYEAIDNGCPIQIIP